MRTFMTLIQKTLLQISLNYFGGFWWSEGGYMYVLKVDVTFSDAEAHLQQFPIGTAVELVRALDSSETAAPEEWVQIVLVDDEEWSAYVRMSDLEE
jgi:hypothetical protein